MHSQETCEVEGCFNFKTNLGHSNYCSGHTKLRAWFHKGKSLESFLSCHSYGNLHHGKPLCSVDGCFHRAKLRGKDQRAPYCSYHFDVVHGHFRTAPQSVLTDYSLPISLEDGRRYGHAYSPPRFCCVKGCASERYTMPIARNDDKPCISKYCKRHYKEATATHPLFYTPGQCCVEDCTRSRESKGIWNGKRRYSRYCSKHRRQFSKRPGRIPKPKLNSDLCSCCGWMGPCDKHRLVAGKDGGRYIRSNVIVVCPNCHRLLHRGLPTDNQRYYHKRTLLGVKIG